MKKLKPLIVKDPPAQPAKCRGCVWGKWEGKQFCSKQVCVKGAGGKK